MATDRVIMEKTVLPLFLCCFYPILFILAGNDDMHESSVEFKFLPDPTTDCGVSCPLASEKIPIDLLWEITVLPLFLGCSWSDLFYTCN